MALFGSDKGAVANSVAGTTFRITPGGNFSQDSLLVLCVAYDNSAASGADPFSSISSSIENTWFTIRNELRDPGAANAGSALRIFGSYQSAGALQTTSSITITFTNSTTVKVATLMEISSSLTGYRATASVASGSNQTTATPSITTATVTSSSIVLGVVGREANGTRTGDADTTNGSWTTAQATGSGTTTGGQEIISQRKTVTTTATQTYNPTFGGSSADGTIAYVIFDEQALGGTYVILIDGDEDYF